MDFNNIVKAFKVKYNREPLDDAELIEFIVYHYDEVKNLLFEK